MVSMWSVDGEESHLEALHVEAGMGHYLGAGRHMSQKGETVADGGVGLAA